MPESRASAFGTTLGSQSRPKKFLWAFGLPGRTYARVASRMTYRHLGVRHPYPATFVAVSNEIRQICRGNGTKCFENFWRLDNCTALAAPLPSDTAVPYVRLDQE